MGNTSKKYYLILVISVILASLLPVLHVYMQAGNSWKGIAPSFVDDDLYYYARMQNVVHGYPLIGNPYFFEHRGEISPSFFVADWLSTAPEFFGLSFISTVILNFVFWSIAFALLMYALLRKLRVSPISASVFAFVSYALMYMLLLRPSVMQIVAPFFVLFCLALAGWLLSEKPTRSQNIFLTVSAAVSFYIYSYSWQITLTMLGLTGVFLLWQKNWPKLKSLIGVGFVILALALPIIFYTLKQLSHPYFWQTMARINLDNTRLPTLLSFVDVGIIALVLLIWYLTFRRTKATESTFIFITGAALAVMLFSNVITGKDFEISNHIDRYVLVWMSFTLFAAAFFAIKQRRTVLYLLFLFSFILYGCLLSQGFGVVSIIKTDTTSVQAFAAPFYFLRTSGEKEAVVWSDAGIGSYIPIYTSNFTLFHPLGGLHLMSDSEVEERYLVSHYFDNLTLTDIENDYRQYAGVGNAVHEYKTYNRKVKICTLFFSYFGATCGQQTNPVDFKGISYFEGLLSRYQNNIKPHIMDELAKFHVKYLLKDTLKDTKFTPEKLPNTKLVYRDARFEIYEIKT